MINTSDYLNPGTALGVFVINMASEFGKYLLPILLMMIFYPPRRLYKNSKIKKLISNERRFKFQFDPSDNSKCKIINFQKNGLIGEGQNENENSWKIRGGNLEILNATGQIFSRFAYDKNTGRLVHTNDLDTLSILGQYMTPYTVPSDLGAQ